MRKRVLALLTAAAMVLSCAPAALADTTDTQAGTDVVTEGTDAEAGTDETTEETAAAEDTIYTVSFPEETDGYTVSIAETINGVVKLTGITDGSTQVLAGDDLTFAVEVDEAYAQTSDVWVYSDGLLLTADADGYYTVPAVEADVTVTILGIGLDTPSYHTVTVPESGYYTIEALNVQTDTDGSSVIDGGSYAFTLTVADGYTGDYTVSADGETVEADADGIYLITDVTADVTVAVDGTFALQTCAFDVTYDADAYSVTIAGETVSSGTSLSYDYGTSVEMAVSLASEDDGIKVIKNNTSSLAYSASTDTDGDGTADTYTYTVEVTEDTSLKIASYSIGITWLSYTGDLYGTAWTYGYVNGGKVLAAGDSLEFYIELLEGYTESPLDVYARISGGGQSLTYTEYDEETHRYYYEITDLLYGDNSSNVTSIMIYVASSKARYTTRVPIQANSYQATFYTDTTGSEVYTTEELSYGGTVSMPDDPEREDYKFNYWVNAAGKAYDFNKTVTGSVNLYASWLAYFTVTFQADNGEDDVTETVLEGNTVSAPSDPEREGYTFAGWYTEDGAEYDFTAAVSADLVLTAVWTEATEDEGSGDGTTDDGSTDGSGDGTADDGSTNGSGDTVGNNNTGSNTVTTSAEQTITVKKTIKKTVKVKKLKKKKVTFKIKASAQGKLTYTKISGKKALKISKTGKVTVKKGTKKGTYKMKVRVSAAATASYQAAEKTITVKVKVK